MRYKKVYLEITNSCNLNCSFCRGTGRKPEFMQEVLFRTALEQLKPYTSYLYFHLMGEPLLHPQLSLYLELASEYGYRVILTTNGTMLSNKSDILCRSNSLHKINISLHSFEANESRNTLDAYLEECFRFGATAKGKIISYRLWNLGGREQLNEQILSKMKQFFPEPWEDTGKGIRLSELVYLQYAEKFDWPDLQCADYGETGFCYGLRDHFGILCDGTVVPCCLDGDGEIALGNIRDTLLSDILNSKRSAEIYRGFSSRRRVEELCRHCGYAQRFQR